MTKNILVLTGSPRKDGNSDTLAQYFIKGAEKTGAEVQQVNTSKLKINACIACDKCWEKDVPCVFRDDMDKIYPLLEWADTFVFACPLYFYTYSAQLKVVLDRLYSYEFRNRETVRGKNTVLLVTAGTENPDDFDGIVSSYKITCEYLGWNDKGIICADSLNAAGDILNTKWLEQAQKLGESL